MRGQGGILLWKQPTAGAGGIPFYYLTNSVTMFIFIFYSQISCKD